MTVYEFIPKLVFMPITGLLASLIGALPFGLVNLNVMKVTVERDFRAGLVLSLGASVVEIMYGLTAVFAGQFLDSFLNQNPWIRMLIAALLFATGFVFFIRKNTSINTRSNQSCRFVNGMALNLMSVQVLLFWIMAVLLFSSSGNFRFDTTSIIAFLSGIWLGKMLVLSMYAALAIKLKKKASLVNRNINRVIGITLCLIAAFEVTSQLV